MKNVMIYLIIMMSFSHSVFAGSITNKLTGEVLTVELNNTGNAILFNAPRSGLVDFDVQGIKASKAADTKYFKHTAEAFTGDGLEQVIFTFGIFGLVSGPTMLIVDGFHAPKKIRMKKDMKKLFDALRNDPENLEVSNKVYMRLIQRIIDLK